MNTQLVNPSGQPRDEVIMGFFGDDKLPFDVFLLSEFSKPLDTYITMYVARVKETQKQGPVNVVGMPLDETLAFFKRTML